MNKKLIVFSFIIFAVVDFSCGIYKTLVNVSRLQFKVGKVGDVQVASIPVENKKSLKDFNTLDALKITEAVTQKSLPVSFTLNVEAKNPNDGTGGYPKTNLTLTHFQWRLFLDDKETVSGDIGKPVSVPGTGEVTTIPLKVNIDLVKFFGDRGLQSLINLALSISGNKGSSSKITLYATPAVSSPFGEIRYPQEIKIVSMQFTN